ncbi:MAG TPA: hypothetical protein DEO67_00320, partial [Candidatus Edwardsbacteria bacterium]|nr:hypothetical protein [Candidatus Edwardsbacteria bacterium]
MKSFKFFSTALFVLFTSSIFNAASGAELYVMFKPNIVKTEAAVFAKGQVTTDFIQSKSVTTILNKYGCSSINATVPKEWADTISYAEDGSLIKTLDLSRIYKMVFPETKENLNSLINELENDPDVAFVDKPFNIVLHAVPDDPSFGLLWGLSQSNDCDIDATEAWDVFKGSSSIIIGIMDTGVKLDHEDLYGKASGEEPTGSTSSDGHGTHVAGTAAAIANNGKGVTGVDWNARIYSKNVLSLGDDPTKMYLCLKSAVDNGCHVLNNSWGDGGDGTFNRSAIRSAFAYMYKMNRVAVTSMGNNNTSTPQSPAAFGQGIIAVGATDKYDARASYSSYGSHIDVVAPGGETYNDNRAIYSSSFVSTTSYEYKAGTSMAAPHVSGLASLLKGYNPNLSNDDIEQIIRISADNVPNMGGADWDQYYGHGRINARKALDLVGGPNYCINRWSATGATTYQKSSMGSYSFYTVPGLAEGPYLAYRYEIRKTVTFPVAFSSVPTVWGRGVGSNGYNADFANYALPFTEVVPGTVTKTGCVLRTYIYEVYNYVPQRVGWFPYENPASAVFQYTVLAPYTAPASAKISGWYEPYTATKAPIQPAGYINLSWSCVSGTLPIKYTVQVKEPYTTGTWTNVISNTTITSCRLQHEPYTGGSGYRVIVNDGKTTLTSNAVVIYPPNPGDPIVSYSTTAEATAHSNGKKLVIDNSGKLHVVFTSNDTVYHTTSVDDGETWSTQSAVGQGKNPAIEMTSSYKPTICWSKGNELYNSQHSADVWGAPQLIYTGPAGSEVSYLAYVLDRNTNNSYLGWVDEGDAGSSVLISPYTPGGSGQLAPSPIDQGGADAFKSPSLALDRTGKLKITWSRDGKVYYYDQAGQLELGENGIHPIVETYGDRTSVVWQ